MQVNAQSFWATFSGLIIAVGCLSGAIPSNTEKMYDGIALATSIKGRIQMRYADGKGTQPKLHDTLKLSASSIKTGKGAHIFLALSNGMAVGIAPNSEVLFETFTQKPFTDKKESLSHEPSTSILTIRMVTGKLAIVTNKLSPLSQIRVYLSTGELQIQSSTCIIQEDGLGVHITATKGSLTHHYANSDHREFIFERQSIRISPQSAMLGKVTERITPKKLPTVINQFAQATQQASKRVFFKAGNNGHPPQPVRIASPSYLNQSIARPYQFDD
jgi:hypothetical protein